MTELHDAWEELTSATPPGWSGGRPSYHHERNEWLLYAFDATERPRQGKRSREWTAMSESELGAAREMARRRSDRVGPASTWA